MTPKDKMPAPNSIWKAKECPPILRLALCTAAATDEASFRPPAAQQCPGSRVPFKNVAGHLASRAWDQSLEQIGLWSLLGIGSAQSRTVPLLRNLIGIHHPEEAWARIISLCRLQYALLGSTVVGLE